jgi:hypothetical protein
MKTATLPLSNALPSHGATYGDDDDDAEIISLRPMGGRPLISAPAAASPLARAAGSDRHPLHRAWQWWVHRPCYDGSSYDATWEAMSKVPVATIESFWRHQNNLALPSALFGANRERVRMGMESAIEGISFFEDDVLPAWEHVRNAMGASVVFKGTFGPRHADAVWENVLLALVGEQTGDDSVRITGARLVDRVTSMRVEIWLDDDDDALAERIGRWFMKHVFDGVVPPAAVGDFFVSKHVRAKTTKGQGYRVAPPRGRRAPPASRCAGSGRGSGARVDHHNDRHHHQDDGVGHSVRFAPDVRAL